MMSIDRQQVSIEEAIKIERSQREKYGATLENILSEEARKISKSEACRQPEQPDV